MTPPPDAAPAQAPADAASATPPPPPAAAPAPVDGTAAAPKDGAPPAAAPPSVLQKDAPKGTSAPGAAAKAADGAAATEWKPVIPDGVTIAPEQLEVVRGFGLSPEASQKVLDAAVKWQAQQGDAAVKAWQEQGAAWYADLQKDPEFGGTKFAESAAAAQRACLHFGGAKLAQALQERGLDNFPPLAKFLTAVGRTLQEDSVSGTTSAAGQKTPANDEEALKRELFPSMFPKEA